MTMLEDAMKSRSLEETMQVRDIAELIADSTDATIKQQFNRGQLRFPVMSFPRVCIVWRARNPGS
jgi:hypothetical protein